jgi:hypothetical protein
MARKKPARPAKKAPKKAKKTAASKPAARSTGKKAVKKTATKAVRKPAKKTAKPAKKTAKPAKKAAKPVKTKPAARKVAKKKAAAPSGKAKASKPAKKAAGKPAAPAKAKPAKKVAAKAAAPAAPTKKPNLDRPRKTVADIHGIPSSLGMGAIASAAHSGGEELRDNLKKNTSSSPRLTAGDVDADWQSADSTGDEAPGGDNPTPDQDVVDEIGRALGVEYADDEELQGGAEITERDTHRWELDPSSKEDFEDEE